MTITVAQFLDAVGRIAPWDKAAGWDPVGLQLGDPHRPVATVAVAHEITETVVARLVAEPVDLVLTYHPLLFRPTTRLVAGSDAAGRAFQLVRAGVDVATVHTAFDVAPGGAADALAATLGLTDINGFGPNWGRDTVKIVTFAPADAVETVTAALVAAGAGTIGNYSSCSFRSTGTGTFLAGEAADPATGTAGAFNTEPETRIEMLAPANRADGVVAALVAAHPYEEPAYDVYEVRANAGFIGRRGHLDEPRPLAVFAADVEAVLGGAIRVAGNVDAEVSEVAVVPGSGSSFSGAVGSVDVLVTGDVTHHTARGLVDRGVGLVDPGHAATERPGIATLYSAVAEIVEVAIDLGDLTADPWETTWKR